MRSALVIFVLAGANVLSSGEKQLPSDYKICKRDDTKLSECFKNTIMGLSNALGKGIPEMRIGSLNPLHIIKVRMSTPYGSGDFTDIKVFYANDFNLNNFAFDLPNNKLFLDFTFPFLELHSKYNAKAELSGLSIDTGGKRDFEAHFTKLNLTCTLRGSRYTKNGKEYIKWKMADTSVLEDAMTFFYCTDLFPGNPQLTNYTHGLILENQSEITSSLVPQFAEVAGKVIMSVFTGIFASFSINELFE